VSSEWDGSAGPDETALFGQRMCSVGDDIYLPLGELET